jgi:hypothetical protein
MQARLDVHLEEPVFLLFVLCETKSLELVLESISVLELLEENTRLVAL